MSVEEKRTFEEFAAEHGVDMQDERTRTFYQILYDRVQVTVDDEMYGYLGYKGQYNNQKYAFTRLLKKYPRIQFDELVCERDTRKRYYILNVDDFKFLLTNMRGEKMFNVRNLMSQLAIVKSKYEAYERDHLHRLIQAEIQRSTAADAKILQMGMQMARNVDVLMNVIAPRLAPRTQQQHKTRCLGLYETTVPGKWYLMRRQLDSWAESERLLVDRGMRLVKRWDNVSHSIDLMNQIKSIWTGRGNWIENNTSNYDLSTDGLVASIEDMIRNNEATELAQENQM